jgi:hypothetical protein
MFAALALAGVKMAAAAEIQLPQLQGIFDQVRTQAAGLLGAMPGAVRMAAAISALRPGQVGAATPSGWLAQLRGTAGDVLHLSPHPGPWPFGR